LSDYTSMITDIISWTNHDEIVTAVASSLIQLGEKRCYRTVRVTSMEATLSVTMVSGAAALPADFIALKHVRLSGSPDVPLGVVSDESIYRHYPTRSTDSEPKFCAVEGSNLIFGPYPDTNYTVKGIYYKRLTALSTSNTTNFFTGDGFDALFFASLAEAEPFLKNDPRVSLWEAKYMSAVREINKEYKTGRFSGPLRSRSA